MTVATNGYTLSTTAYTEIASVFGRVRIVTDNNKYPARVVVAATVPDATTDDWFPLQPGQILSLESMEAYSVWAMANAEPSGGTITQKVRVLKDAPGASVITKPLF